MRLQSIATQSQNANSPQKNDKAKIKQVQKYKLPQVKFNFLTEEKIQEATHLYTKSFVAMNPMWQKMGATYNQVFGVNRSRVISCTKGGWVCIMTDTNNSNIVTVAPSLDLIDYVKIKVMPNSSHFLKTLGNYGHELEDQILQSIASTAKRGEYLYNYGGAVDHIYAKGGISRKFWAQGMIYLRTAGWKTFFSRATHVVTRKLLREFGGKAVKTVHITEPGMQGQFMQLIRLQLNELSYGTLTKYLDQKDPDEDDLQ